MKRIHNHIKSFAATATAFAATVMAEAATPVFENSESAPIIVSVPASTGLQSVIVLENSEGVRLTFPDAPAQPAFGYFDARGGAYAVPVPGDDGSGITLGKEDIGVVVSFGGSKEEYYWIVNYANHRFEAGTLAEDVSLSDCSRIAFDFSGEASPIRYYSINGRGQDLSREIRMTYTTLVYDETAETYLQQDTAEELASLGKTFFVPASGCATSYSFTPDRFIRQWYPESEGFESAYFPARLVTADVKASQDEEAKQDNEKNVEAQIGGSAPVNVTFHASVTDACLFHEWQFSRFAEFEDIDRRFTDLDFVYEFTEAGTTYARFVAADASGACDYTSETYEIFIGESRLECPNAFSPYGSPGVNDEWKVSYQSIISFECHIFSRWGKEICSLYEPWQGWDGKSGGKLVPPGVYYYVIKATGADGRKYNLSGDINLIKARSGGGNRTEE